MASRYPESSRLSLKKNKLPIIVILILLGGLLRIGFNHGRELWLDEIVTLLISKGTFEEVIQAHQTGTSAPIFYGLTLNIFIKTISDEHIVRFISWFGGILSIPMAYQVGYTFRDRFTGWLLAFTVAIHSVFIQFSMELREYSWVVFLTLLWFWSFHKAVKHIGISRHLAIYTAICTVSLWTQYGLAIVVGLGTLILSYYLYQRHHFKMLFFMCFWLLSQVIVIYFLTLRYQLHITQAEYLSGRYGTEPLKIIGNTLQLLIFASGGVGFPALIIGLYPGLHSIFRQERLLILGVWASVLILSFFTLYPYSGTQQAMFLAVLIFITGILGLCQLAYQRPRLSFALFVMLWIGTFGSLVINVRWTREGKFSTFTHTIESQANTDVPVVIHEDDAFVWEYYADNRNVPLFKSENIVNAMRECLNAHSQCWYITYGEGVLSNEIRAIKQNYATIQDLSPHQDFRALLLQNSNS